MKITISDLESSADYEVVRELGPDRVIVNNAGIFVIASRDPSTGKWDWASGETSEEDRQAIAELDRNAGLMDTTVTSVTKR
jgi:hypothetical protein